MDISVDVEVLESLPKDEIEKYVDLVVFGIARNTLDYTAGENRFPYLTGNLQRSAMAEGVRQESPGVYYLGADGADYAVRVWEMPQETTNWTNPDTYAQWYVTTYKNKQEIITLNAVNNALRSISK